MSLTENATTTDTLRALDDFPLAAQRFPAAGEPIGRIVVASATGVPQGFYRRFASYAASRGFTTVTFDYRGIGASRPASLTGFEASFLDWAELDLAGVVRTLTAEDDATPLHLVGHSFGGQALGLLPDPGLITSAWLFGTGVGWSGWMPRLESLRVRALWPLAGLVARWKGYLAWSLVGMGEDLPLEVFRQWRRWSSYPNYFFDDPEFAHLAERFAQVTTPIVAVTAADDRWATFASRGALMAGYRNAPWRPRDVSPADLGGPIGHMGYFRPAALPLWCEALDAMS